MDRRHALKNIGLSMGAMVVTPTIISLLQSCQNENEPEWFPEFFSQEEGSVIRKIVDVLLPETDTPSGSQVNVHKFIDVFVNEVMEVRQQDLMRNGVTIFTEKTLFVSDKNEVNELKEKDIEQIVSSFLKISKEADKATKERFEKYTKEMEANEEASIDDDTLVYIFLDNIRGLSIWSYKSSEIIGKEALVYDPVPGRQQGCVDLEEATKGKAWSL